MAFLRRSLTGVLLMALTLGLLVAAANSVYRSVVAMLLETPPGTPARETVQAVETVRVATGTETPVIEVFGDILSHRTLDVRASAPGRIVDLAAQFRDGGRVEAGDLLARIDPSDFKADVALAGADLAEAAAELRDAERAATLAKDDLSVAEEQAELRGQALKRQQNLNTRGVGSDTTVEAAALDAAASRQLVVSRKQALQDAEARIDRARTEVDRMKIAVATAERRLADTEIRARFGGVLSNVAVVEGGLVSQNEELAQLVDPAALEVGFRLSTAQYARLLNDARQLRDAAIDVVLETAGFDLQTTGRIDREGAVVGAGLTGRAVFARLADPAGFRPGDIVTVRIREAPMDLVSRLPARAVDSTGSVLVVGADQRLTEVPVEVLRPQGDTVIVRAQSLDGAEIVALRSPLVGAGIKVKPIPVPGPAPEMQVADESDSLVTLTPARRAQLIAFVESNGKMPEADRSRVLTILANDRVPAGIVRRLESLGG